MAPVNRARVVKLMVLGIFVSSFFLGCAHLSRSGRRAEAQLSAIVTPVDKLRHELEYFFSTPDFENAHWGVAIQSLKTGEYIFLRNENKGFMPASNMKLFTTAAALLKLGPDFRFQTALYRTGQIDADGILNGDLVILGSGDPTICGRYHDGDLLTVFKNWADSLKSAGINEINGDIIGDDNYFEDEIMGAGWAWDYQSEWYAAQISALSFNDNCIDILYSAGDSVGAPATFSLEPETDYVQIKSEVTTTTPGREIDFSFDRQRATNNVTIRGSIALGNQNERDYFSVENPTLYATHVFKKVLMDCGIVVHGKSRDIDDLLSYDYQKQPDQQLALYVSPPLGEIVHTINKVSQNLYAELLMRTLGAEFGAKGSAREGAKVIKEVCAQMGINPGSLALVDGSGLSRYDLITPMSVLALLRYMKASPVDEYFYDSLPVAGVDGTLSRRMKGTLAEGNVRAKTGTLDRVRALSGYVTSKDGEEFVFTMIVNNYTVPRPMADIVQNTVCERLANFTRQAAN